MAGAGPKLDKKETKALTLKQKKGASQIPFVVRHGVSVNANGKLWEMFLAIVMRLPHVYAQGSAEQKMAEQMRMVLLCLINCLKSENYISEIQHPGSTFTAT
jgi:hypothetical protein